MLRSLGIEDDADIDLIYRQFYTGMERQLTDKEWEKIQSLAISKVSIF